MLSKRKQRELALQILFVWDANGDAAKELAHQVTDGVSVEPDGRDQALAMATGAWEGREASDKWVERLAPQWPPRRQPGVDRNLIRLAMWELTHADTPPKVVIDEAIELARHFSTEQSPSFVNGVLDAVFKEISALKMGDRSHETEARSQETGDSSQEGTPIVEEIDPAVTIPTADSPPPDDSPKADTLSTT